MLLGRFVRFLLPPFECAAIVAIAAGVVLLVVRPAPPVHAEPAPKIMFSPRSGMNSVADFMALFEPDSPWQSAGSQISAFEVTGEVLRSAEVDLPRMLRGLRDRNIALGVGIGPLTGDGRCGKSVEGYSAYAQPLSDAQRFKAAGAVIEYLGLDEPLYFGHTYTGQNACHSSIVEIAEDVAIKVKQIHSVYPGAPVGDVEPVGTGDSHWRVDLEQWIDAFRAATGQNLAFFRADIQWKKPWQAEMDSLRSLLQRKGIALQVIYNGQGDTDAEWTTSAVAHFEQYETDGRPPPDVAVIQSWTGHPTHALPEADPTTLSGVVNRYVAWRELHSQRR
jgi:hypothetical protein